MYGIFGTFIKDSARIDQPTYLQRSVYPIKNQNPQSLFPGSHGTVQLISSNAILE